MTIILCILNTSTGNIVQRVLTNLFADLPYTALYIDDLCVFSSGDMNQHIEYVREVLKRLTAANLFTVGQKTDARNPFFSVFVAYILPQWYKLPLFLHSRFPTCLEKSERV